MNKNVKLLSVATIIVAVALSASIVLGLPAYVLHFPHEATVPSPPPPPPEPRIKVFSNAECTLEVVNGTTIDWGTVSSGANTKTYWIKNTGIRVLE